MEERGVKRKLAVVLVADVEGSSRPMGADEEATLKTPGAYQEIIDGLTVRHDGRVFGMAGGSVLAELGGAADLVRCTIAVDEELSIPSAELPDHRQRRLRIVVDIGGLVLGGDHACGARGNLPPPFLKFGGLQSP